MYISRLLKVVINHFTVSILVDILKWRLDFYWTTWIHPTRPGYLRLRLLVLPFPQAGIYEDKWMWIRNPATKLAHERRHWYALSGEWVE